MSSTLDRALREPGDPPLRHLPAEVADLLLDLNAPPRLAAHLRAVHDVAAELTAWLADHYPTLVFDHEAVLFGAATHDIGKTVHVDELSGPGSRHEPAGQQLLLDAGVSPRLARFAGTHARWQADSIGLEDLIVSLADKIWKAKRVPDLEQLVVDRLVAASGEAPWQAFLNLDDVLDTIAAWAVTGWALPLAGLTPSPLPRPGWPGAISLLLAVVVLAAVLGGTALWAGRRTLRRIP